jgi:predicted phage terminase large subunit-like protein
MECARHVSNPKYNALILRRNSTQIFTNGGLWDSAAELYPLIGGKSVKSPKPMYKWPNGAKIVFGHLERYSDAESYQGSQIPLICFDELTHFDERCFWYMLSRNRSTSGIRGYIRATTNPDPDSFVAKLIEWYIGDDGYAINERSGVVRYFGRVDGQLIWGDNKEEVLQQAPSLKIDDVKSFTFIASSISDNKILLEKDKGYLSNLRALPLIDQERLLHGNWKIKPASGLFFKRSQVEIIDTLPNDVKQWVRAWDLAATAKDDADATASVLLGKRKDGTYVVANVTNNRLNASDVRNYVLNTAKMDKAGYKRVKIRLSQDPGQAGKEQSESYVKMLAGFSVVTKRESGDKLTRAEPVAAQWQHGNVQVLAASWNDMFFNQLEQFGDETCLHDDMVDALANAFNELESAKVAYAPPKEETLTKESYWLRG